MRHAKALFLFASLMIGAMLVLSKTHNEIDVITDTHSFSASYLLGRIARHENKNDLAIRYFQKALTYKPDNTEVQREVFETALSVGAFKDALEQAKNLKKKEESNPLISLILSVDHFTKKNYKAAQLLLQEKIPPHLNNPAFDMISAWITFGSGNKTQAIADLEKLLDPTQDNFFIYYHLALMNNLAKHDQEAKKYFIQALNDQQSAISVPDTYEHLVIAYAHFLLRHKMHDQAIKVIQTGKKLLPDRVELIYLLQQIENKSRVNNLIKTPQQGAAEVLYNFGTALNQQESKYIARFFQQLSLALYPDNGATMFQLANVSIKFNDITQAIKLYNSLSPHSPYYKISQLQLALIFANDSNSDKAINLLIELKKKFPHDHDIVTILAILYIQQDNFSEAVQVISHAISQIKNLQQNDWKLFYQRAIASERLQQWTQVEDDLRQALQLFPNQPQVLNYLGYSLVEQNKKLNEALNMLKKASQLQPHDGYILDSLGWAYYKLKQYDKAVQLLERAVKLEPQDPTLNDHLGDAYWQVGSKRKAIFQWKHAIHGESKDIEKIKEKLKFGLQNTTTLDHMHTTL
ncbi:tetratricopeptide repeat protein [Bartonella ancashensis]|uniref:TPR domain protein n=1 Tax=Bartonella ancashensis TaxID=1318743 RepID=A0A0M4M718_9HYPH|nr:tetratricopeptide repeat protein [Bartonella ancashensis]ALE04079.1 TPR domain protein [Bartonella ancashensis]